MLVAVTVVMAMMIFPRRSSAAAEPISFCEVLLTACGSIASVEKVQRWAKDLCEESIDDGYIAFVNNDTSCSALADKCASVKVASYDSDRRAVKQECEASIVDIEN